VARVVSHDRIFFVLTMCGSPTWFVFQYTIEFYQCVEAYVVRGEFFHADGEFFYNEQSGNPAHQPKCAGRTDLSSRAMKDYK
jgi:hypothetical protein